MPFWAKNRCIASTVIWLRSAILAKRAVDFRLVDGDVQTLGLLQLQRLLDQAAQHLGGEPRARLLAVGDPAGQGNQLQPIVQVLAADHVVVDDRHDALLAERGTAGPQARSRHESEARAISNGAHLGGPRDQLTRERPTCRLSVPSRQGA